MRGLDVSTNLQCVNVFPPQTANAGSSLGVNMKNASRVGFVLAQGATGGGYDVTVEQCLDSAGTGAIAIPYYYRKGDTTDSDSLGKRAFNSTGAPVASSDNDNTLFIIDVTDAQLTEGLGTYVRVTLAGGSTVTGTIVAVLSGLRYASDEHETAL